MDPAARTGSGGVVGAGAAAGKVHMAAAAVARGVVVVLPPVAVAGASPAGAAAAAKPALNLTNLRRRWAQALFILGCAAAALAFFSINSSASPTATTDSRSLLGSCAPTDAEAAALRAASKHLLWLAAVQVLAATRVLKVPAARQVANFLACVGLQTGYHATRILLKLFECHGRVDTVVAICCFIFLVLVFLGYFAGSAIVKSSY